MQVSAIPSFLDSGHLTLTRATQTQSQSQLVATDGGGDTLTLTRSLAPDSGSLPEYTLRAVYAQPPQFPGDATQAVVHDAIGEDEAYELSSDLAKARTPPDFDLSPAGFLIADLNTRGGYGGASGSIG